MTPTKDQQAQEYAEKKIQSRRPNSIHPLEFNKRTHTFDYYDIKQAFEDGYTACEQSMWRSVEDELPEEDGAYLILTTDNEIEIFVWEDGEWLVSGYTVAYWRELPSLPTQTPRNIKQYRYEV